MKKILVIEDDEMLNAGLCYNLQLEGFEALQAFSCSQAGDKLKDSEYDMVLLDVNLPDGNGFDLAKEIRKQWSYPILFVTANDMDEDMILGFESGADDYITKPFNIKVLLQRMKAIFRRCEDSEKDMVHCGNLQMEFSRQSVKKSGKELILTPTELKLLQKFVKNRGQVLTRKALLEDLWDGEGNFVDEHTLTIHMSRLRSKIKDSQFTYIKTIYGIGYQWIGEKYE